MPGGMNIYAALANAVLPESGKVLPISGAAVLETQKNWLLAYGDTVPTATTAGYSPGCIFIHTDGGAATAVYVNEGTLASCLFVPLIGDLNSVANGKGASRVGVEDSGSLITAATVEAALAEAFQHIRSIQAFIPIPLMTLREATNFDVSNIAANGGLLASDTTPILSAINDATDGCQRVQWVAANVDQVIAQVPLPPDLDVSADLVLHMRIVSGGTTDAVGFTVDSFFNEGDTKVVDTSETNQTTAYLEKIATIAAADVPAGAQTITIGLTPVAHTTDTLGLSALWLEYKRTTLTS